MKYIRYTSISIRKLTPNICHMGSFCEVKQRKRCEKEGKCLQQLCGDSEKKIAKVSIFKSWEYGDKTSKKIEKAVEKYRKDEFRKCKAIRYNIEVVRK